MIALQRWKDWFGREKKPYLSQYSSNIHKSAKSWLEFKKKKAYYDIAKYVGYMKHKNAYINEKSNRGSSKNNLFLHILEG